MSIRSFAAAFFAFALVCAAAVCASAQTRYPVGMFRVGSHVMADPTAMHRWIACTITAVRPSVVDPQSADSYVAKCADGIEYVLIADANHVKSGGTGGVQAPRPPTTIVRVNGGGGPLRSGVYHCIAGFSTMITYGDITVSGFSYTFRAPDGSGGSGTYTADANGGLHWSGDFGVLSRPPWIIESSNKQPYVKDAISFYYHSATSPIHRSMSCRRTR